MTGAALSYAEFIRGLDVMTNMRRLKFPRTRGCGKILPLDFELLRDPDEELSNLVLFIDEIREYADARRSQSHQNLDMSRMYLQSRKRDMHVIGTTQGFGMVDTRMRDNTDLLLLCKKMTYQNGQWTHVWDPLWRDPAGEIHAYSYTIDQVLLSPNPLRINMGKAGALYDTREIIRGAEYGPKQ